MKSAIKKTLLALVIAGGILSVSEPASAYWRHGNWYGGSGWYGSGVGYHHGWRSGYHHGWGYKKCTWVPGHWRHGYWVPAQKRCWY